MNRTSKGLGTLRVFVTVKTYSEIWDNMGYETVLNSTRSRSCRKTFIDGS